MNHMSDKTLNMNRDLKILWLKYLKIIIVV